MEAVRARSRKRKSGADGPATGEKPRASAPPGVDEDGGGGIDRVSALPDAVLGEIISLLPTEDGARTQILAPRWRHLWRAAPLNLVLDCNPLTNRTDLVDVVSRILSSHLAPARRFCVQYLPLAAQTGPTLDAWLRAPVLDNLQELELYQWKELPPAPIFRFSLTLRVLDIGGFQLPDSTIQGLQFPHLKQLAFYKVTISECSLHSLIGGCPVLECLMLTWCLGFRCVRINSLTLRGVAIDNSINYKYRKHVELNEVIIDNAPCLERLLIHLTTCLDILVVAAPKLDTIGFLSDEGYMSDQPNRLVFGSTVIQGLRVDKLAMPVRTIKTLAVQMKDLSLDTVIDLMTYFPCLEKLYIRASKSKPTNLWRRKHKSLDISLKTIVLESYRGVKSQVNFVTFFVLNARVLDLITLKVDSMHYSEEFKAEQHRKLHLENRASRDARFNFTTQSCVRCSWDMKHVHDFEIDPFI